MKKKYTAAEILDMAVKKTAANYYADLDRNGTVDVADARIALRREQGLDGENGENGTENAIGGGKKGANGENAAYDKKTTETPCEGAFGGFTGVDTALKKELLDEIMAETGRTYDIGADRLYNDYKREYEKNASAAARNAYGISAASTGGYGSSYAASAASAAYGKYMSELAEKLPEFAESASKLHQNEIENRLDLLETVRKSENDGYSRYSDAVKNAWTAAENGDYTYLEALGMNTDGIRESKAFEEAVTRAKYGDYSGLKFMGVDTSAAEYAELLDAACKIADKGDYSYLEALGVDVGTLKEKDRLEKALALAKYGDYSLLGSFSSNFTAMKEKIGFTVQRGAEAAYRTGGYNALVRYLNSQKEYGQITEEGKKSVIKALTGN